MLFNHFIFVNLDQPELFTCRGCCRCEA